MKVVASDVDSSAMPNEEDPVEVDLKDVEEISPFLPKTSSVSSFLSQDQSCGDDSMQISSIKKLSNKLTDKEIEGCSCNSAAKQLDSATCSTDTLNSSENLSSCSPLKDGDSLSSEDDACSNSNDSSSTLIADQIVQCQEFVEDTYAQLDNVVDDETTPLNDDISSISGIDKETDNLVEPVVVIEDNCSREESSWKLIQEEHKERRAREAVAALNQNRPHEKSSPFGYKSWLLQLSHRRRFEILIAIGLFLWLAFFIVLAIFMNGPASQTDVQGIASSTDGNLISNSKLKPVVNQSISINNSSFFAMNRSLSPTIAATTLQPLKSITEVNSVTSQRNGNRTTNTSSPPSPKLITPSKGDQVTSQTPPAQTTPSTAESSILPSSQRTEKLNSTATVSMTSAFQETISPTAVNSVTSQLNGNRTTNTSSPPSSKLTTPSKADQVTSQTPPAQSTPSTAESSVLPSSQRTEKLNSTATVSMTSAFQKTISPTADTTTQFDAKSSDADLTRTKSLDAYLSQATNLLEKDDPLNLLDYEKQPSFDLQKVLKEMKPNYRIGLGRADITGPAADVNMMGYANPSQKAAGLHMRQYARSYLIAHGSTRVVFVNIDACMASTLVKLEVLKKLKPLYGDLYTAENLCISGTHTHSAPAGFLQDVLFQVTSMGYVPETLTAMLDGIVTSIQIAHNNLAPGYILINKEELLNSNINRSPAAYLNNPEAERKKYKYDVDKEMILLKFLDSNGNGIGMLNWFAVHCTSMNNSNTLISGDNKGYAELLFERDMNPGSLTGHGDFVAAFAQSNEGDVSPNLNGPHCVDTGLPCDNIHSTCNGKVQNCIASGPGKNMFESTEIIGRNQFNKAKQLYESASVFLTGPVQAVHQYLDMTDQSVVLNSTHTARTCKPAMGFSFAAGTTDGPGAFNFKQAILEGDKSGNAFWKLVRNFLHSPSRNQTDCHYPKPILVDTGEMSYPYSWQPEVVDTQVFRIGQLLLSAVPGEFSTMSGRRLRDAVLQVFTENNSSEKFESVIAGLSNTYSDYITTYEEYHVQRYEGASTIFGPHTLSAYIQQYKKLATSLVEEKQLTDDVEATNLLSKLLTFVPGVVMDSTAIGYDFGDVLLDAKDKYTAGESVEVQFVSGNPRNSPTMNMTFLTVERRTGSDTWEVVKMDGDWDTKYIWERSSTFGHVRGLSEVTVLWDIPLQTPSGHYRINHYGHYKYFWNRSIYSYKGTSKVFYVSGITSTK